MIRHLTAVAAAVLGCLAPMAALVLLVAFAVVMLASRIVSLSSMAGALTAPIALWLLDGPATYLILALFLAAMIIVRHRGNIQRLLAGTEPRMRSS